MSPEGYKLFVSLISEHITRTTQKELNSCSSRFACFSSDGSDDCGHNSQEGLFLRVVDQSGKPRTIFIGLEELNFLDAANLWEQIKSRLSEFGWPLAVLKKKLIGVCFDGASVNMGVMNGLQALVKRDVGPWVLVIHCVNHNFELALLDMRKDDPYLVEFEETLKKVFSTCIIGLES